VLLGCIAAVAVRNRTDTFASMGLRQRLEYTAEALSDGRCGDAERGLMAVERLGVRRDGGESLRGQVELTCGHLPK
jgi:hypothetical protein